MSVSIYDIEENAVVINEVIEDPTLSVSMMITPLGELKVKDEINEVESFNYRMELSPGGILSSRFFIEVVPEVVPSIYTFDYWHEGALVIGVPNTPDEFNSWLDGGLVLGS